MNEDKVEYTSDMFGSLGGEFEAMGAKETIEKSYADIVAYMHEAERNAVVVISPEKSVQFYQDFHDEIVRKDVEWKSLIEETAEFGSASAEIVAGIMRQHMAGIKDSAKRFIDQQIALGTVEVNTEKKNVFFAGLVTAATKSLDGLGGA